VATLYPHLCDGQLVASLSLVSELNFRSLREKENDLLNLVLCEHKPDTAVRYPAEGSERASWESGVASRDKTLGDLG
jgi:hypothetical protein